MIGKEFPNAPNRSEGRGGKRSLRRLAIASSRKRNVRSVGEKNPTRIVLNDPHGTQSPDDVFCLLYPNHGFGARYSSEDSS